MQLTPVWRTNTRNPLNREGCRCYTVDEIMMILDVGRKAVYSLIRKKSSPQFELGALATGFQRIVLMHGCIRSNADKENCVLTIQEQKDVT